MRENIARAACARHGEVLSPPSLTRESLLPVCAIIEEKKNLKRKCTHHSCHPVDEDHDVEDDSQEVEYGHHIQPVLGSTDHATDCFSLFLARSDLSVAA